MKKTNKADPTEKNAVISRVTWVGLYINLVLAALKVTAGYFGNSRAVLADGVHSLSDLITDLAVLIGVRFWSAPADSHHPYGHQRIETLVTLFIGFALVSVAAGLAWDAVHTIQEAVVSSENVVAELLLGIESGTQTAAALAAQSDAETVRPVRMLIALLAALLSIGAKEWLYRWTSAAAVRVQSSALKANAWHHRSDALSSIPAAVAVGLAYFVPAWRIADQIGALIVALFILHAAWQICRPALENLMDKGADSATVKELTEEVYGVAGVKNVHSLRTRYLGASLQVDIHVMVDGNLSVREGHDIANRVEHILSAHHAHPTVEDVLVHIEPWDGRDANSTDTGKNA